MRIMERRIRWREKRESEYRSKDSLNDHINWILSEVEDKKDIVEQWTRKKQTYEHVVKCILDKSSIK